MPTFREDIRLGTKVPQMKTEDYEDRSVTTEKLADKAVTSEKLETGAVLRDNIQEGAVGTNEIENNAITIEKIAQAVWDKLKNEYLRIDGSNFMHSDMSLNDHNIRGVKEISNISALPIVIAFNKDGYDVKLEKWETSGGDDDPYPRSIGGFDGGSFEVPLNITASGFKTNDRSTLGLLNNNSEVITAMTDSDIDSCISSVFG